ncbi:MAG: GGDEF domain-containing protein [Geobacteraceae bacterium]|nr:GGDEF domain-containing protein [Geobacteraceae bacterium]
MNLRNIVTYLENLPKWQITCLGLFTIVFLAIIDSITGDFSIAIFYLVPVFIGAWFIHKWAGFALSLLCGAAMITSRQMPVFNIFDPATIRIWNTIMEISFLIIMNQMFSLLRRELELEKALARTDYLTGALNRRSFMELVDYEVSQSRRYQRPLTLVYIDLDNFKAVNDGLGHHTGDQLLCDVVSVLRESNRSTDLVARLGGDEFCLLYPETATEAAADLLRRTQEQLLSTMEMKGWPVTFSIGAVTYTTPPATAETIIREADTRMYEVKEAGKNMISHVTIEPRLTHGKRK